MKTLYNPEKNINENKQGYLKIQDLIIYIIQIFTIVTVITKRGIQDDDPYGVKHKLLIWNIDIVYWI